MLVEPLENGLNESSSNTKMLDVGIDLINSNKMYSCARNVPNAVLEHGI